MAGRTGKRLQQIKDALLDRAYLITLGAVIAVIAGSAMYTGHIREESGMQVQAAARAPETVHTPETTQTPAVTPLPTIAPLAVQPVQLRLGGGTVWPLSGGVIRGYSGDAPVYWEALSCVQVHRGVDIAGQAQEDVLCLMDGVVERVTMDEVWGCRVYVAQTDGSEAVYAGLAHCLAREGQAVTRGQTIGALLGSVPCEAELGPHLHLEIADAGQKVDPAALLERAARP